MDLYSCFGGHNKSWYKPCPNLQFGVFLNILTTLIAILLSPLILTLAPFIAIIIGGFMY